DKYARLGIRVGDLVDERIFREKLSFVLEIKNRLLTKLYGVEPMSLENIFEEYRGYARSLAPHVADATAIVYQSVQVGQNVLLEGAQGAMLDVDFGTYPFVTSSTTISAGGYAGVGLPPNRRVRTVGVYKAYTSRVGGGPFPTELFDDTAAHIREVGHEYGTTTGRPRRCGWFDAVVSRYSVRLNGIEGIALTRLDVLDDLPSIRVCTAYRYEGQTLDTVPASIESLQGCEPVYETLAGWQHSTSEARTFADLPANAQSYVRRLEELLGCPAAVISVGPRRDQTIIRQDLFAQ
ncbi:MAG: adenylosuccinate synthetase, partial [Dehalococcoidales bacterium]|nr:adenylosuccinate synthetase [Dehalococcoidales bacterium]